MMTIWDSRTGKYKMPAILTPGAYWENSTNNIYRLIISDRVMCWVYDCKSSFHERWGVNYAGPYESEEFPQSAFTNLQEVMRYAETAMMLRNT